MKRTLKIIAALLVIVIVGGMLSACESEQKNESPSSSQPVATGGSGLPGGKDIYKDPIRIAMIVLSTGGIVNQMYRLVFNEQTISFPNVTINYMDGEFNPSKQITLIEECITQGYDAIFLEPMDPVALSDAITRAEQEGIPVLTMNVEPQVVSSLHITVAHYKAGWDSAQVLDNLTKGMPNRTAIVLDCPPTSKPGAHQGTAFEEYCANTDIEILEMIGIEFWSADNAMTAMRDMLTKYGPGQITMVYCASGDIALGAMNAIKQTGRESDGILVWGFQTFPSDFEAIREGRMAGTMFSDIYLQTATMFYYALYFISTGLTAHTAGYTKTPYIAVPMIPVTQQNVDQMMDVSRWFYDESLNP